MNQDEINSAEWNNPENWSSPRWLGIDFSKQDVRSWVPKPIPKLGWTVNLGQPKGVAWGLALFTGAIVVAFLSGWFVAT